MLRSVLQPQHIYIYCYTYMLGLADTAQHFKNAVVAFQNAGQGMIREPTSQHWEVDNDSWVIRWSG